jgi:hypothetical protein
VFVNFASSNPAVLPSPPSLLIAAGQSSGSTLVVTNSAPLLQPVSVVLQGETGASVLAATVTVATTPTPTNVLLGSPQNALTSVTGATTGNGFVPFTATLASPGVVTLSSANPALLVPVSIPVPIGASVGVFPYTALPVTSVIGIGAAVTRRPLPHHRAYGSVHGGSSRLR